MIRRPPRSTLSSSSAASDVYKRQVSTQSTGAAPQPIIILTLNPRPGTMRLCQAGLRGNSARMHRGVCSRTSVSGLLYSSGKGQPRVQLFTKEGCTLCDEAVDALWEASHSVPHTLEAVDITDPGNAQWRKYRFDIPVLHLNGEYWTRHHLSTEDAIEALKAAAMETGRIPTIPES
eukprot:TRINITY_DN25644_c0_g1_i1.p1 TRINITY_DN25644_c0_g1~~TRINITY_DN25644_c0_g1_i1.p1  ORF type:complete len:176 (-),score=36.69 TRINITY_DN25644_c0_g1_i1:187-714(-)